MTKVMTKSVTVLTNDSYDVKQKIRIHNPIYVVITVKYNYVRTEQALASDMENDKG